MNDIESITNLVDKAQLKDILSVYADAINKANADNAALSARIKVLEDALNGKTLIITKS